MHFRRICSRSAIVTAIILVCSAHIGSPDAWYAGNAGSYSVLVQVTPPNVVPGIAKVSVLVKGGGVRQVTASINKFDATAASPPPDVAVRDPQNPERYTTELWVMSSGSNSVTIKVIGEKGTGTAFIPVVAIATQVLKMDKPMGFALGAVGLFLLVGAVTIVGSAVREGVLEPGQEPDSQRFSISRIATGATSFVVLLMLFGGWKWWNSEETGYRNKIPKPFGAVSSVHSTSEGMTVSMAITESLWVKRKDRAWLAKNARNTFTPLIPDHGKLMHLFVIGGQDNLGFAHLHPATSDTISFTAALPSLPPGKYKVFGDVVHESGLSRTLVSSFEILPSAHGASRFSDPDDAVYVGAASTASRVVLEDGSVLKWNGSPGGSRVGVEAGLTFSVMDSAGNPLHLEPYMGMAAHSVVMRDDGSVFIHLHPGGTISMASQMTFEMRQKGDSVPGTLSRRMAQAPMTEPTLRFSGENISFPYAFPTPGNYLVWVQVRRGGKILTGAFRIMVKA